MDNKIYTTSSSEETKNLGKQLAKELKPGDFLAFYGNLGSGKTTFIQGLAEGLGIKRRIISPTFIIVRHFSFKKGNFYHVDLYRTETNNDLLSVGLDEIIEDKTNIVALEWAEKLGDLLPQNRYEIDCKYIDEYKREIRITKYE